MKMVLYIKERRFYQFWNFVKFFAPSLNLLSVPLFEFVSWMGVRRECVITEWSRNMLLISEGFRIRCIGRNEIKYKIQRIQIQEYFLGPIGWSISEFSPDLSSYIISVSHREPLNCSRIYLHIKVSRTSKWLY